MMLGPNQSEAPLINYQTITWKVWFLITLFSKPKHSEGDPRRNGPSLIKHKWQQEQSPSNNSAVSRSCDNPPLPPLRHSSSR
ncbi:hypothetical protein CDAR_451201 [Caerostris darwini]|uniref:Uncharacterized protein n=1 Tax=Caerostris darwini TaxID=1538125 RepID=A0AAV4SXZ2_9ARAC|nr:hypothetical protein CDAR_451201 [Caerostris darwini]